MLVTNILFSLSYTGSTNCQAHKSTLEQTFTTTKFKPHITSTTNTSLS